MFVLALKCLGKICQQWTLLYDVTKQAEIYSVGTLLDCQMASVHIIMHIMRSYVEDLAPNAGISHRDK